MSLNEKSKFGHGLGRGGNLDYNTLKVLTFLKISFRSAAHRSNISISPQCLYMQSCENTGPIKKYYMNRAGKGTT
jgi:hypothetical protein